MELKYYESVNNVNPAVDDHTIIIGFTAEYSPFTEKLFDADLQWKSSYDSVSENAANDRERIYKWRAIMHIWIQKWREHDQLSYASITNAMAIFDVILSRRRIPKSKLHILGVISIIISSKWHDDNNIEICGARDSICKKYSIQELVRFEHAVINFLDWKVEYVTAATYISNTELQIDVREVSLKIAEIIATTPTGLKIAPANLAAICIFCGYRLLGETPPYRKANNKDVVMAITTTPMITWDLFYEAVDYVNKISN